MNNRDRKIEEKWISVIVKEYVGATEKNGPFNSLHEGYAVLLEEVDELWEEVKKKKVNRSKAAIAEECSQIAAMAYRLMVDCCGCGCEGQQVCNICQNVQDKPKYPCMHPFNHLHRHPEHLGWICDLCNTEVSSLQKTTNCNHPKASLFQDSELGDWTCGKCGKYIPIEELCVHYE